MKKRSLISFSNRERVLLKNAVQRNACSEIQALFAGRTVWPATDKKTESAICIRKNCFEEISELQYAYETGQREALLTLLQCGADPVLRLWRQKRSLLEEVVAAGDDAMFYEMLPFLNECGRPQIFFVGKYRICTTVMGLCAAFGRTDMAKALKTRENLSSISAEEPWQGNAALPIKAGEAVIIEEIAEPWRLAMLCSDNAAMEAFFQEGRDEPSEGWGRLICLTQDVQKIALLKKYFPKMMKELQEGEFRHFILESANAALLSDAGAPGWNIEQLGLHSESEKDIWHCYRLLKKKLLRPLTASEKKRLVVLALQHRSQGLLHICEEEWSTEGAGCDVTDCIEYLPLYDQKDAAFAELLAASPLRLSIQPEEIDCDLHWQLFQDRQLSILHRLAEMQKVSASVSGEVKPNAFVQAVLHMRTKAALHRLIQWELIRPDNIMETVNFITERRLTELYDPIIACACRMRA